MPKLPEKYFCTAHRFVFFDEGKTNYIGAGFMNKSGWELDFDDGCYARYVLVYLLNGSGTFTDHTGNQIRLKAGDVFRRDTIYPHKLEIDPDSNWQELYITFTRPLGAQNDNVVTNEDSAPKHPKDDRILDTLEMLGLLPEDVFVKSVGLHLNIVEMVYKFLPKLSICDTTDKLYKFQTELLQVVVRIWFSKSQDTQTSRESLVVDQMKQKLEKSLHERTPVKELIADLGASYSNLRRTFSEHTKISPGDYRIKLRVDYACELLITTDLSIGEIAEKLGYHDQFIFSRQFKKLTHTSPLKYRKENH